MAFLKLRPWPFGKDEVVELYWLCSPSQNKQGQWRFKAIFLNDKGVPVPVEFSWGLLPNLRLGQKYSNGLPMLFKKGVIKEIHLPPNTAGTFRNAFNLPAYLRYLFKNSQYGKEIMWSFEIGTQTFYVSCLEIIRAFFARNKMLANALLKPNGLDLLIDRIDVIGAKASVELSRLVPKNLISDRNILHMLWLYGSIDGRSAWDAVYNNLLSQAIDMRYTNVRQAFQQGLPLKASLPADNINGKWVIRAIEKGQSSLIIEILSINGLRLPYSEIEYSHPLLGKRQKVQLPRKVVRTREQGISKDFELDELKGTSKTQSNEETIESSVPGIDFIDPPEVKRLSDSAQKVNSGSDGFSIEGSGGAREIRKQKVSFEDTVIGGEITPGEFKGQDVLMGLDKNGFEEFSKVVEYIQKALPQANISSDIIDIPLGKKFSFCSNGTRRKCACIYVDQSQLAKTCILEILRSDDWDVSTLIVQPKNRVNLHELEKCAVSLIYQLTANGGHWKNEGLNKVGTEFKIERLKHMKHDSVEKRGKRMLKRIMF